MCVLPRVPFSKITLGNPTAIRRYNARMNAITNNNGNIRRNKKRKKAILIGSINQHSTMLGYNKMDFFFGTNGVLSFPVAFALAALDAILLRIV
jgi:cobalamin biosynthesis Co2+ chelatase CbiK